MYDIDAREPPREEADKPPLMRELLCFVLLVVDTHLILKILTGTNLVFRDAVNVTVLVN
jgi:hypothetical protein